MDLWIRSQDKERLVQNPKLGIEKVENKFYIVEIYNFENSIILGIYAAKERALEVLDEIQNAILGIICDEDIESENKKKYTGTAIASKITKQIVYEMPDD